MGLFGFLRPRAEDPTERRRINREILAQLKENPDLGDDELATVYDVEPERVARIRRTLSSSKRKPNLTKRIDDLASRWIEEALDSGDPAIQRAIQTRAIGKLLGTAALDGDASEPRDPMSEIRRSAEVMAEIRDLLPDGDRSAWERLLDRLPDVFTKVAESPVGAAMMAQMARSQGAPQLSPPSNLTPAPQPTPPPTPSTPPTVNTAAASAPPAPSTPPRPVVAEPARAVVEALLSVLDKSPEQAAEGLDALCAWWQTCGRVQEVQIMEKLATSSELEAAQIVGQYLEDPALGPRLQALIGDPRGVRWLRDLQQAWRALLDDQGEDEAPDVSFQPAPVSLNGHTKPSPKPERST